MPLGRPLGVTLEADLIKQKLPTNNGGYTAILECAWVELQSAASIEFRENETLVAVFGTLS